MAIFNRVFGKKDDFESTLAQLNKVITDLDVVKNNCNNAIESGNYNRAKQYFLEIPPLYDKCVELSLDYLGHLIVQGNPQHALEELENLQNTIQSTETFFDTFDIDIENIKALNSSLLEIHKGIFLLEAKKYRRALKSFETVLESNDSNNFIWRLSGDALLELGYENEALEAYEKALSIEWHDAYAWAGKARVLHSSGQLEDAFEAYETALEIDESNEVAIEGKEVVLAELNSEYINSDSGDGYSEDLNPSNSGESKSSPSISGQDSGRDVSPRSEKKVFQKPAETKKDDKPRGFACVAGMNELKDILRRDVIKPLKNPENYKRFNVTIPNGILLYGPPGCGKTFIVEKLAEEVGYHFINVPPSKIGSKYVHETSENIASIFKEAKNNSPTILFFDEFEAMVPRRESLGSEAQHKNEEINEFLTHLNNASSHGILVVGATNQVELIDSAVMRAGRIDKVILVPPPDFEARKELFKSKIIKVPHSDDIDFDELAEKTEYYSSSDITAITAAAGRIAGDQELDEINRDLMLHVVENQKPSISRSQIESYVESSHLERK